MGVTKFDSLNATTATAKYVTSLPTAPYAYYGSASNDVDSVSWVGGELAYHANENRLYVQTATSGTTATWKRLLEQFATTTSTSTTTSSSTTTSTSTSTSSSTSSSTSTSSTTTS
jgi:hypothetical protein